jgi:hypothetical protein
MARWYPRVVRAANSVVFDDDFRGMLATTATVGSFIWERDLLARRDARSALENDNGPDERAETQQLEGYLFALSLPVSQIALEPVPLRLMALTRRIIQ